MIYVLSGGGAGGTLIVDGDVGDTITVVGGGKTRTKTVGSSGQAVFKDLATGEYTVTRTNGSETSDSTVAVTVEHHISLPYFKATIQITYPATSTCTVSNSSGAQVATNTNTGSSAKTWTATVGAADTYTITATATDGSGKSKAATVEITVDEQSESVTINYELWLYHHGTMGEPELIKYSPTDTIKFNDSNIYIVGIVNYGRGDLGTAEMIDLTGYKTLYARFSATTTNWTYGPELRISNEAATWSESNSIANGGSVIEGSLDSACLMALDLTGIDTEGAVHVCTGLNINGTLTELYLI